MSDWLHGLPVAWMALVIFGATYLLAGLIYAAVNVAAAGERARAFKAVSPGLLSPLGVLFGLLVIFTAAGVWGDIDRANSAVNREASALRSVVLLAASFPGEPEERLRNLVRQYIDTAAGQEWPMMARHAVSLTLAPEPLAIRSVVDPSKSRPGDGTAGDHDGDRECPRRAPPAHNRQLGAGWVKWSCLILQAIGLLVAIAMMHSDNRRSSAIALGLFATGIAFSVLLIASHNRPFTGEISVGPEPLLQVRPTG
jgi:hypothetical protein